MHKTQRPDAERAALAQRHQIETLDRQLGKLQSHAAGLAEATAAQDAKLSDLDVLMAELSASAGIVRPGADTLDGVAVLPSLRLSAAEEAVLRERLPDLSLSLTVPDAEGDWQAYMGTVDDYVAAYGIDLARDPIEQLLPANKAAAVHRRFEKDFGDLPWDEWDYATVALAVMTGALLDYFIVATPRGDKFKGENQRGSPVTKWLCERSKKLAPIANGSKDEFKGRRNAIEQWIADAATAAEKATKKKTPYDLVNPKIGLTPNVHRLSSLGHSVIFGMVFGIRDILMNTCTFIDAHGRWQVIPMGEAGEYGPAAVLDAAVRVLLHAFSDVFTPQGLPAPFLSQLQMVTMNSGLTLSNKPGAKPVSVTHVTRYMYSHGYDLRHFATMSMVPAAAELTIRTYHAVRTWQSGDELGVAGIRGQLKLAKMLTLTHALLASSNIVKTAFYNWNPTAFNLAQFVITAKQMVSLLKLAAERDELIQDQLADGWASLLAEVRAGPAGAHAK